jgi:hypothetical protein
VQKYSVEIRVRGEGKEGKRERVKMGEGEKGRGVRREGIRREEKGRGGLEEGECTV